MNETISLLLVDDNSRNLDALESLLDAPELTLVRAANADEALMALVSSDFAVIILDVQMPGISGLDLAKVIKARKKTQHIPIIFLTAHFHDEREILYGYSTGAVDYLTKPINPDILKSKVAVFVDVFRKNRTLSVLNTVLEAEIQQRRKLEKELWLIKDALEQRVTERTARLVALLDEKDLLLREIHHRVKNNMQIMSSLLSLQSRRLPEPQAALLNETQGRIRAMALVHEKLYQSENLTQVDMVAYVQSLLRPLLHLYSSVATRIQLKQDIAALLMPIDIALPCGLIINELVSNALKYAFYERESGEIVVELHEDIAAHRLHLRVRDNGVGLPDGFDEAKSLSLGLRLVQMLSTQLQGHLEIHRHEGSEFFLDFPAPESSQSPLEHPDNRI